MTRRNPIISALTALHDFHERAFGTLRDALPQPDPDERQRRLDDLAVLRRPDITVSIYLNKENDND